MIRQIAFSIILIVLLSVGVMFAVNTNNRQNEPTKSGHYISEPDSVYIDTMYEQHSIK